MDRLSGRIRRARSGRDVSADRRAARLAVRAKQAEIGLPPVSSSGGLRGGGLFFHSQNRRRILCRLRGPAAAQNISALFVMVARTGGSGPLGAAWALAGNGRSVAHRLRAAGFFAESCAPRGFPAAVFPGLVPDPHRAGIAAAQSRLRLLRDAARARIGVARRLGLRGITIFLVAAWFAGSALAAGESARWFRDHSRAVRSLVLGLRDAAQDSPGAAYFLVDVDQTLFQLGVEDNPFRLVGLQRVYLFPGEETKIQARPELGGAARWASSPQAALHAIQQGRGRVFRVSNGQLRDMTIAYEAVLLADPRATRIDFIDAGDPSYADRLGPTWYRAEAGMRWMPGSATVRLSGPTAPGQKLYVTGYVPPAIVAGGPVTLAFSAAGEKIGEGKISRDGPFAFDFPLPSSTIGKRDLEIAIQTSRVVRPAADPRDFGAVFGTFAIR